MNCRRRLIETIAIKFSIINSLINRIYGGTYSNKNKYMKIITSTKQKKKKIRKFFILKVCSS